MRGPVFGEDNTGQNAYEEVIGAASGNTWYSNILAYCTTQDALLSLDGGDTDHIPVPAGQVICLEGVEHFRRVHAKNRTAGSNYAALVVMVW